MKDIRSLDWLSKKGSRSYLQTLIFTTFHRVLNGLNVSVGLSKALILIQFAQLTMMLANDKNTSLIEVLPRDLLYYWKFILIYPYLKDFSYFYTILALVPVSLFVGLSGYFFFKIFALSEKRHKEYEGLKRVFGLGMYCIDTILVIPFFGICFKATMCGEKEQNQTGTMASCSSSSFFVPLFISIILLVALLIMEVCVGMFFFNFDFKLRDNLARSYNIMHLIFRIYCMIVVGLDVYIREDSQKLTTVFFVHFIFASIFCIDYYNRLPYYNPSVSEFYCYGVFGYFWITLVLLITYLANYQLITDNVVYIILIGLGFFLYVVRTYREYFYRGLLIKEIDEIDNEIQLDVRFRYLIRIVQNSKKNKQDELLLSSIIKVHTEKCVDPKCVCKNRAELYDPKTKQNSNMSVPIFKNEVFIKSYLLMLIKDSCKKLPKSSLLSIDLFLFLFKEMNNIPQVNHNIVLFEKQSQQSLFVTVKYAIYRLKISIYYFLKETNKYEDTSSIMYENIRTFDEGMKALSKCFFDISDTYARMWDILDESMPDMLLLERVCTKLIDESKVAEGIYRNILKVTHSSLTFLIAMSLYSRFIVFDDLLFMEIQARMDKVIAVKSIDDSINCNIKVVKKQFLGNDHGMQLLNMEGPYCSISISFSFENLGQIVWSSESCLQVFEYDSSYLKTFNVAHIIPSLIAKHHNRFLTNYFHTGKNSLMNKMSHLWAVNKSKVLFSVYLLIKLFISKEGLTVLSLIRQLNDRDYILVSKKGRVDSCGKRLKSLLNFLPQDFYEKNLHLNIMALAPKLIALFLPYIYDFPDFLFEVDRDNKEYEEL